MIDIVGPGTYAANKETLTFAQEDFKGAFMHMQVYRTPSDNGGDTTD